MAEHQDKEFEEMQVFEQQLHNILLQKQSFQMERSETRSALEEIESSGDEIFKLVGQLLLKVEKKKTTEELKNKEKIVDLRLKSLDKQENSLTERIDSLREKILGSMNK